MPHLLTTVGATDNAVDSGDLWSRADQSLLEEILSGEMPVEPCEGGAAALGSVPLRPSRHIPPVVNDVRVSGPRKTPLTSIQPFCPPGKLLNGEGSTEVQPAKTEDEVLLEALAALTAAPAAFSASHRRQGSGHTSALDLTNREGLNRREEQEIVVEALVSAIECQQSSVSGDLAEDCNLIDVDGEEDFESAAVEAVVNQAELVAAAALVNAYARKGDHILSFHEHSALWRTLAKRQDTLGGPSCAAMRPLLHRGPDNGSGLVEGRVHREDGDPLYGAIGTSFGAVVLLNSRWSIVGVCGGDVGAPSRSCGKVTALSISDAGDTVVSGHERGGLVLWSVASCTSLRTITNECLTPIISLAHAFLESYRLFVLDTDGHLRLLSFTSVLSTYMYRTTTLCSPPVFTPILDVDMIPHPNRRYLLSTDQAVEKNDTSEVPVLYAAGGEFVLASEYLIATVSADSLLLHLCVSGGLQNTIVTVARHSRRSVRSGAHELVCFAVSEGGPPRIHLCISWGQEIEILSVFFSEDGSAHGVEVIARWRSPHPIYSMAPMSGASVLLLNEQSELALFDTTVAILVESNALKSLISTPSSGSVKTERGHVVLCANRLSAFVLASQAALSCTTLTWDQRLNALLSLKKLDEALTLVEQLSGEVALSSVGLHADKAQRRQELRNYIEVLAVAYLQDATVKLTERCALHASLVRIITFCSRTDALDIFFGPLMSVIREARCFNAAMYALESCLLAQVVTSVPEVYIDAFVHFFSLQAEQSPEESSPLLGDRKQGLQRAEHALMHIDENYEFLLSVAEEWSFVSLATTVLSLREHRFSDALITSIQLSGESPAAAPSNNEPPTRDVSGAPCVAIDYIECTMHGRSLLNVELPADLRAKAKREVLSLVLSNDMVFMNLLRRSPERLIDILLSVFGEEGRYSPWDRDHFPLTRAVGQVLHGLTRESPSVPQTREETCATVSFHPSCLANRPFPPYKIIDRYLTGIQALGTVPLRTIHLRHQEAGSLADICIRNKLFMFQCAEDSGQRLWIQTELTELLLSLHSPRELISVYADDLVRLGLARCLGSLYARAGNYEQMMECYMSNRNRRADPGLLRDIFPLLRAEMRRLGTAVEHSRSRKQRRSHKEQLRSLHRSVLSNVPALVRVDSTALWQFIYDFLPGTQEDLVTVLKDSCGVLFRYLDNVASSGDENIANDIVVQRAYLELMCACTPWRVYPYLKHHEACISYDIQLALHAAQRYHIYDAAIYLLGRTLRIDEAMELLATILSEEFEAVRTRTASVAENDSLVCRNHDRKDIHDSETRGEPRRSGEEPATDVPKLLEVGIDVCVLFQRRTLPSDIDHWLCFLGLFGEPRRDTVKQLGELREITGQPTSRGQFLRTMLAYYTKCISAVIQAMVPVVDLGEVLRRVIQNPDAAAMDSFSADIAGVLSSLHEEVAIRRLCETCTRVDVTAFGNQLYRNLNRGFVVTSSECCLCHRSMSGPPPLSATDCTASRSTSINVFRCGHSYHEHCRLAVVQQGCPQCIATSSGHAELMAKIRDSLLAPPPTKAKSVSSVPVEEPGRLFLAPRCKMLASLSDTANYHDVLKGCLVVPDCSSGSSQLSSLLANMKHPLMSSAAQSRNEVGGDDPALPRANGSSSSTEGVPVDNLTDEDLLELFCR